MKNANQRIIVLTGPGVPKELSMLPQDVTLAALSLSVRDDLNDPRLYLGREMSMLEFQRRVLDEAINESNPLLERVKFLAIIGSNLDDQTFRTLS